MGEARVVQVLGELPLHVFHGSDNINVTRELLSNSSDGGRGQGQRLGHGQRLGQGKGLGELEQASLLPAVLGAVVLLLLLWSVTKYYAEKIHR